MMVQTENSISTSLTKANHLANIKYGWISTYKEIQSSQHMWFVNWKWDGEKTEPTNYNTGPEDGGSMFLQNVCTYLQAHKA
jgi:hypothetical protein